MAENMHAELVNFCIGNENSHFPALTTMLLSWKCGQIVYLSAWFLQMYESRYSSFRWFTCHSSAYIYIYIYMCVYMYIYIIIIIISYSQHESPWRSLPLVSIIHISRETCKAIFCIGTLFTNPCARAGYETRAIFKRSLTGLNSEFSFS